MIAKKAILAVAFAFILIAGLALSALAALPTVYHPAGDIQPGNFSEGAYWFANSSKVRWGNARGLLTYDQGASMELGGSGTPYIDFSNDNSTDFDIRIRLIGDDALEIEGGNVGIGTASPGARLSLGNSVQTNMLYLWEGPTDAYGFGIAPSTTQIYAGAGASNPAIAFGKSDRITFTEWARIMNGSVANSCGGNWLTDATALMFRQNPGGGCGDDAYIAYYSTGSDKTVLEIAARNDGFGSISDSIALMPGAGVGIGTTIPDALLTVQGGATGSGLHVKAGENDPDYIMKVEDQDGSVQAMYINTNGDVGMGTTDPQAKLDVKGDIKLSDNSDDAIYFGWPTGVGSKIWRRTSDGHLVLEGQNGVVEVQNSALGIGTTSPSRILTVVQNSATDPIADSWTVYSSRQYKENITALSEEELKAILEQAAQMKLYHYTFKNDSTGKVKLGIISEESPSQILTEDGKAESINEYIAFLHAAIKAQQKELEELKKASNELKSRVEMLETG